MLEAITICEELTGADELDLREANRTGDHIWWISDVGKFQRHYPDWQLTYDVPQLCEKSTKPTPSAGWRRSPDDRSWQTSMSGRPHRRRRLCGGGRAIFSAARQQPPVAVSALAVHGVMTGVLDQSPLPPEPFRPVGARWPAGPLGPALAPWREAARPRLRPEFDVGSLSPRGHGGLPIFLFGGTQETITVLCDRLIRASRLDIAGLAIGISTTVALERDAAATEIRPSGARIAFIGLGCPRQEVFAFEMREQLGMPLLAVGAAFNFHAGILPQAPPALQRRRIRMDISTLA